MVKQNKAKVSKSKWVFLLNVIASGMARDGYWSASSSAITTGMAIREACWFLGKQAFSPLPVCGLSSRRLEKNLCLSCSADRTTETCLSFIYGVNMIVCLPAVTVLFPGATRKWRHHYRSKWWPWTQEKGQTSFVDLVPKKIFVFHCLIIS